MKKGMTRRRLLALVLCLAMLFSCVPQGAIPVFAAGDEASQGQTETGETTTPTEPEVTTEPTEPEVTTVPTEPEDTTAPTEPEVTTEPTQSADATAPTEPEVTTETTEPQNPAEPAQPQNPAVPLAGTEVASDNLTDTITYTITAEQDPDGTLYHVLTLEGTGAMPDYKRSTYTRAPWCTYRDTLRQVVLGDGITSVGAYAFYSTYQKLVNLQLPSTLITIGDSAFEDCSGLTGSLDFSGCPKLTTIGSFAFFDCTGLTTLNLSSPALTTIGNYAFYRCTGLTGSLDFSSCPALTSIGDDAFYRCTGLTGSLDFSSCPALTSIGSSAFSDCTGFTSLDLTGCAGIASIGDEAFYGCSGITSVNLTDCTGLQSIGSEAFNNCDALTTLDLTGCTGLETIGDRALYYCESLTSLNLTGCTGLKSIGSHAFYRCTGLTGSLDLTDCSSLTSIGYNAFYECTGITSIDLTGCSELSTIDTGAFYQCTGLTGELDFSGCTKLATIHQNAFLGCTGLTSVNLGECSSLTEINKDAFKNCVNITSVSIPSSIEYLSGFYGCTGLSGSLDFSRWEKLVTIGENAFYGCTGLTGSLDFSNCNDLTTIEDSAFYGCTGLNGSLNFTDCTELTTIGNSAFYGCTDLAGSLNFRACQKLTSIGSSAFYDCTGLNGPLVLSNCTALTTIGGSAFEDCTGLTGSLDLGNCTALTTIGGSAFGNCTGLTGSLNLGNCTELTSIGSFAFDGCTGLTSLNLTGCQNLTSIGTAAFAECSGLTGTLNLSGLQKLESIGSRAFDECSNLTGLDITNCTSLTSIGSSAFYRCTGFTGTLDFSGCVSLTSIGNYAFYQCSNLTGKLDFSNCTSLSSIGTSAFEVCGGFTSASLAGCTNLKTIGSSAFSSCNFTTIDFADLPNIISIGDSAFAYNEFSSLDLSGLTALTSIGPNAFYNCINLTSLDLSVLKQLTTIGSSAFAKCTSLASLNLTNLDKLSTIGASAFSGCEKLSVLDLTGCTSLRTIEGSAFANCSSLLTLRMNSENTLLTISTSTFNGTTNVGTIQFVLPDAESADGLAQLIAALPQRPLWISVSGSEVCLSEKLLQIWKDSRCSISFTSGFYTFTLGDGAQAVTAAAPFNTLSGSVWVDSQGAMYVLSADDATASLAYIPSNLRTYTVPGSVGAEENSYGLTSVSSHALARAYQLKEITFTEHQDVTLADFALAACPTLSSVNGKTTVEEAKTLFKVVGESAFLNTGLSGGSSGESVPMGTPINASPGVNATFTLTAQASGPIRNQVTGTGNPVTIEAYFGGDAVDQYWYRIYFLVSHGQFNLGGLQMVVDQPSEDNGVKFVLRRHPQFVGLYYVDVSVPKEATWNREFVLNYPVLSSGGQVLVWAQSGAVSESADVQPYPTGSYYNFTWETEAVPYSLSVTKSVNTYTFIRSGVENPITITPDLTWQVNLSAGTRTDYGAYASFAQDPARQAVHTMTFTLPDGLSWNSVLSDDVQTLTQSGDDWCLGDMPILKITSGSNTYVRGCTVAVEAGKLVLRLPQIARGQSLPTSTTLSVTLAHGVVVVENEDGFAFNDSHEISLQIDSDVIYTFDEAASHSGETTWRSDVPEENLEYEKISSDRNFIYYLGDSYYQLVVRNETLLNRPLKEIVDPLPKDLFITPEGIQDLFTLNTEDLDNQQLADFLTLTISNARQYHYINSNEALGNVTLSDGSTQYLLTADMTDEYDVTYTDDVTVTITLGQGQDTLMVRFGTGPDTEVPMNDLEVYLKTQGFALLSDTQYTVTWHFGEDNVILSGDTYLLQIPVEPKNSFQLLELDQREERDYSWHTGTITVNNTAKFLGQEEQQKSVPSDYKTDYSLSHSREDGPVQNGGVLDYTISVNQLREGTPREEGLPVVAVVSGITCLMAPVLENQDRDWVEKAEIFTDSHGVQYYLLAMPESEKEVGKFTYQGVWINGYYADSVTVTALDKLTPEEKKKYNHTGEYTDLGNALASDGYMTEIRWYLTSTKTTKRNLKYSFLVDMEYSLKENALYGTICSIAYLNDRDNQRLFFPTGSIPIHFVTGNKELLDDSGQVIEGGNSTVSSGETEHYRLAVSNDINQNVTVGSQHIVDVLPSTYGAFEWTTENVEIRYALASGASTGYFDWQISYDEHNSVYELTWPEGVQIPAKDILYIYVDLTFPEDTTGADSLWKTYCEKVQGDTLVNTFRLVNMAYSVTHNLALPGNAYIQKGVLESNYYYDDLQLDTNRDMRYYSEPSLAGEPTMRQRFYIFLYNDGPGPLYLSALQDRFPEGTIAYTYNDVSLVPLKSWFEYLPTDIELVDVNIDSFKLSDHYRFTFSPDEDSDTTITFDEEVEAYYLKPNQGILFYYTCYMACDTDEWEGTVAMPLYDPNDAGVGVAQIHQIYNDYKMYGNKVGNDGVCTYLTSDEGIDLGFSTSNNDEGWVSSSVSLRKETVAGLEKHLVNKRDLDGIISEYEGDAGPSDSLQWQLNVYNDSTNIIDGFTITDTLPNRYTLDVGEVKISGLRSTSQTTLTLFTIQNVKTVEGKVTEVILDNGTTVNVGGSPVSCDEYDLELYYNADDQLVMELSVHLQNGAGIVWPGQNIKLTYWSKNYTSTSTYTTYVNSAVLTTEQQLNYDKVSHGRVQWDESGKSVGILARAIAVISGGYSTSSEKTVTEVDGSGDYASSNQVGSITLSRTEEGYSHFTYELRVNNSALGTKGMEWITLIDNLPDLGDTMTLNPSTQRGSEFKVEFAANPQVKVWYVTSDNKTVYIQDAVIEYSDKAVFDDGDWEGSNTSADWRESSANARSIRIYIPSNGGNPAVPPGASLHVSFECQVGADAEPGDIAWNSFGYRYLMSGDTLSLEAAPLEVGVRIPDYPRIQKVLTDETGETVIASEDTEFYFLVYQGARVSGDFATGAELLRALADAKINFTIATVTVLKGESQAELKLENLKICTYTPENGWKETNNPWVWTDGGSYTVVELGDKPTAGLGSYQDYEFASLDYVPDNSYTFQYNKSTSQLIRGENTLALRKLQIQKVDQADQSHKLSGAVFGLYSPNPGDQLTGEALRNAARKIGLNEEESQELQGEILCNGTTYYLYRLGKTDDKGLITWENLPGMSYCYVELWAPEGYYITQKKPVVVSFQEGDAYLRSVTHTVTNKQIVYLPKTGGMGRWQIPALGLILCAAVVTVFLGKRRKKAA